MRISENTLHGLKSHLVSIHIISSAYRNKRTGKTGAHKSQPMTILTGWY